MTEEFGYIIMALYVLGILALSVLNLLFAISSRQNHAKKLWSKFLRTTAVGVASWLLANESPILGIGVGLIPAATLARDLYSRCRNNAS